MSKKKKSNTKTISRSSSPVKTNAAKQGTTSSSVKISQCMIVKNEEKNIEKALSWGRGIVSEQIVVDTGSTDRTVEIAESMGAKVFHFEWIKDFAAAKNYAIEQACGDWIAFLDADEYMTDEDAALVKPLMEMIKADSKMNRQYMAISCPWVQLDDAGKPRNILTQERLFRNLPKVRYIGRIHEKLSLTPNDVVYTKDFRIMHTGYTGESFLVTGKASRNIELLRAELKDNPDDLNAKAYLAESLKAEGAVTKHNAQTPEERALADALFKEADALFMEVLDKGAKVHPMLKQSVYEYAIVKLSGKEGAEADYKKVCERAYKEFPNEHRFTCYYAGMLNRSGDYQRAYELLKKCEASLSETMGPGSALTTNVMRLFAPQMALAAQGVGDIDTLASYAQIMLISDKSNLDTLRPYIATLRKKGLPDGDIMDELAHIYDMSSKKDLLTIARAAKDVGAIDIARRIIEVAAYLGDDA